MEELNKKLAEWAGFRPTTLEGWEGYYKAPEGVQVAWTCCKPSFTESLDACFKWLVPKLDKDYAYVLLQDKSGGQHYWVCEIYPDCLLTRKGYQALSGETSKTPALALCKAIEKLIDEEGK